MRATGLATVALVLAAAVACTNAPLEVSRVQLGRTLNTDNSVGDITSTFSPEDSVYVAVHTADAGSGTIAVRWEYEGRTASEQSKDVSYHSAASTEFHFQYAGGLIEGAYAVEVFLDGALVERRTFTVRP